jgi:hypothetical protein
MELKKHQWSFDWEDCRHPSVVFCFVFFCLQAQHFTFTNFLSLKSHVLRIFEELEIQNEGRNVKSCLEQSTGSRKFWIYF